MRSPRVRVSRRRRSTSRLVEELRAPGSAASRPVRRRPARAPSPRRCSASSTAALAVARVRAPSQQVERRSRRARGPGSRPCTRSSAPRPRGGGGRTRRLAPSPAVDGVPRQRVREAVAAARAVLDQSCRRRLVEGVEHAVRPVERARARRGRTTRRAPTRAAARSAPFAERRATRARTTSLTLSGTSPARVAAARRGGARARGRRTGCRRCGRGSRAGVGGRRRGSVRPPRRLERPSTLDALDVAVAPQVGDRAQQRRSDRVGLPVGAEHEQPLAGGPARDPRQEASVFRSAEMEVVEHEHERAGRGGSAPAAPRSRLASGRLAADRLREGLVRNERLLLARSRRARLLPPRPPRPRSAPRAASCRSRPRRRAARPAPAPPPAATRLPGGADPRELGGCGRRSARAVGPAAAAPETRLGAAAAALRAAIRRAPASPLTAPSAGGSGAGCGARCTRPARRRGRRRRRAGASASGGSPPRAARARPARRVRSTGAAEVAARARRRPRALSSSGDGALAVLVARLERPFVLEARPGTSPRASASASSQLPVGAEPLGLEHVDPRVVARGRRGRVSSTSVVGSPSVPPQRPERAAQARAGALVEHVGPEARRDGARGCRPGLSASQPSSDRAVGQAGAARPSPSTSTAISPIESDPQHRQSVQQSRLTVL